MTDEMCEFQPLVTKGKVYLLLEAGRGAAWGYAVGRMCRTELAYWRITVDLIVLRELGTPGYQQHEGDNYLFIRLISPKGYTSVYLNPTLMTGSLQGLLHGHIFAMGSVELITATKTQWRAADLKIYRTLSAWSEIR